MPTYEYECQACGHTFDEFQSMTAKLLTTCPKCKKRKLRRLIGTGAALLFKGSGFYTTDYRSNNYQSRAKAESSSAPSGGSSTSESKPADTKSSDAKSSDTKPSGGKGAAKGKKKD